MNHRYSSLVLLAAGTLLLGVRSTVAAEPGTKPDAGKSEAAEVRHSSGFEEIDSFIKSQTIDRTRPDWKEHLSKPPKLRFDATRRYTWHLDTTQGPIVIEFMPKVAPMHVSSTIYLTRLGFYDDILFHRVIPGFMAQGGDPRGIGSGGPGYQYAGEFDPTVRHSQSGRLSMANRGPGTDGSQFFLTFVPTPWLDGKHTIFGKVVAGMRTLKKIEALGTRGGRPTVRIAIKKATVEIE